jgi:hypothetical protein
MEIVVAIVEKISVLFVEACLKDPYVHVHWSTDYDGQTNAECE